MYRRERWRQRTRTTRHAGGALARLDRRLLAELERSFAAAASRAGPWLVCRPGCDRCCHGPFPITPLDAWRLGRGLAALRARQPRRAAEVVERAIAACRLLSPEFPGDPATGEIDADEAELDRYFERHAALPCPALEPGSGRCELYAWRPVACRTFGPPARLGTEVVPPCELCFRGAPPAVVEGCRMEPDRDRLEDALLDRLEADPGESGATLIAYALIRPGSRANVARTVRKRP